MTVALRFTTANLHGHGLVLLLIAAACILIALRLLRTVVAPLGQLVQAVAAVAAVALAMGAAFVFLVAAAVSGH